MKEVFEVSWMEMDILRMLSAIGLYLQTIVIKSDINGLARASVSSGSFVR